MRDPKDSNRRFAATALIATGAGGPSAWSARFEPTEVPLQLPEAAALALEAVAIGRAGTASVSTESTWPLPVVTIDLEPIASVQVEVAAEAGAPPDEITLRVHPGAHDFDTLGDSSAVATGMVSYGLTVSLGSKTKREDWQPILSASRLLPGVHTLFIEASGFESWVEVVDLAAGANKRRAVMRRSAERTGWIAGVVTTESGAAPSVTWVAYVHRMDGATRSNGRMVPLEGRVEGGRWRAHFRVVDLVAGEYDVWIRPGPREGQRDDLAASPRQRGVTLGREDLQFEVLDGTPPHMVEVTVVDGQSGGPMGTFELVLVKQETAIEVDPQALTGGIARLTLAGDPSGAWLGVSALGLACVYQNLPSSPDPDGIHRARVVLMPGWGAAVHAFRLVDGAVQLIADVEVFADGHAVGRTNEQGWCAIQLAARPKSLTVQHASFVLERALGSIDAAGELLSLKSGPLGETYAFVLGAR